MKLLGDAEMSELQGLLDAVPPPLEPLDIVMLDGFLCGVIVQPKRVPRERWLAFITDDDARPLPRTFDARRLHALVFAREAELRDAIGRRAWFDPWVFELDAGSGDEAAAAYPWVAGFASALEHFPAPHELADDDDEVNEALALVYRHLASDDLEDADALLEAIEAVGPAVDLADAVEGLVRATLLLADAVGLATTPKR